MYVREKATGGKESPGGELVVCSSEVYCAFSRNSFSRSVSTFKTHSRTLVLCVCHSVCVCIGVCGGAPLKCFLALTTYLILLVVKEGSSNIRNSQFTMMMCS